MDTSFYSAVRGAMTQQQHMNILANNIANINTYGYKSKTASFQDLVYYNMNAPADENTRLTAGTGANIARTETDFSQAGITQTGRTLDYAIQGNGFFMLRNPVDNSISYTRNGNFQLSQRADGFYLADAQGKLVLDGNQLPIRYEGGNLTGNPGIYDFVHTNGMLSVGDGEYVPVDKNGAPVLAQDAELVQGALENSNADLAKEMAKVIESSRAYSYVLKMVQTSDEVEQTINSLR